MRIDIYTDGACRGNPGPGGYGAVIELETSGGRLTQELMGAARLTTNNRMELVAPAAALLWLEDLIREENQVLTGEVPEITIHTDSTYVLKGVTDWHHQWEQRDWKTAAGQPVVNQDLWQLLIGVWKRFSPRPVWQKVKAHSGHPQNERADDLARLAGEGEPVDLKTPLPRWREGDELARLVAREPDNKPDPVKSPKAPAPTGQKPGGSDQPRFHANPPSDWKQGSFPFYLAYLPKKGWARIGDWPTCQATVAGVSRARYQKIKTPAQLKEVLAKWSTK